MLVAACRDMPEEVRAVCTRFMIQGFRDACRLAGAPITGGQTVVNPWPIIGGVATAILSEGEFVKSDGALPGDIVVLTKPLGTQVAANLHQWRHKQNASWHKCVEILGMTDSDAEHIIHAATCSMAHLNRGAAGLMLKHGAHAATDVTGFGILGHAQNLSSHQVCDVALELHTLPCVAGTPRVNNEIFNFRLLLGYSAETSGGLLVCLPSENVQAFQDDLLQTDGSPSWIVGRVVADPKRQARIVENITIVEV